MSDLFHNLGINWKLLAAQAFNFALVLFVLHRFVFRKLLVFLEERKEKIRRGVELTAKAEHEMERVAGARKRGLELARQEASQLMAEVKEQAGVRGAEIEGEAKRKAQEHLKKAHEMAEQEKRGVVGEAMKDMSRLVQLATEKVLAKKLSSEDSERMLQEVLEEAKKEYAS
ncbi:MAG: hypothetical protein Q8Q38_00470 [bacterium]|nr:hypothetical protein [bacterium]